MKLQIFKTINAIKLEATLRKFKNNGYCESFTLFPEMSMADSTCRFKMRLGRQIGWLRFLQLERDFFFPCTHSILTAIQLPNHTAETFYLANIYLFKVNNRNSRKRCEICSKLTLKTTEWRHVFVNFQHISHLFLVSLLFTLNRQILAGRYWKVSSWEKALLQLTYFWPMFSFYTPWKPLVF